MLLCILFVPLIPLITFLGNLNNMTSINVCMGRVEINFIIDSGVKCTYNRYICGTILLFYIITTSNILDGYFLLKVFQAIKIQRENAKNMLTKTCFQKRKR